MKIEYWLFKENGEDFLEHLVISSFDKERYAKVAAWILNKYGKEDRKFYYKRVYRGRQ
ncbi:hypothetical protein GCM10023310_69340 [Paenibacillus vulneris]|uniref:Phage protein n=1 Tax=Paenibacillus vulneris TaxID=1133364 RepID=A0ABW3UG06_9BACL